MNENRKTVTDAAQLIYEGFLKYNKGFCRITNRARRRFENSDWVGYQQDTVNRVELYESSVRRNVQTLQRILGPRVKDRGLWNDIRTYYGERLQNVPDAGFMKTFFNSITRRIFGTVGIDPELEFISTTPDEGFKTLEILSMKRYPYWGSFEQIFENIFDDFYFKVPYKDIKTDIDSIAMEIRRYISGHLDAADKILRVEFIDSFFYQSARAYLVGRIIFQDQITPLVIALKNTNEGICLDAVLMSPDDVSIIFSYTRSYYFADPNSVVGAVHFLHSILPYKPIDELYTVLGRLRQGKTERYRIFTNHLNNTNDKFTHAEGDRGLVMIVFTLPSYNLVFKIMRDRFGYPKTISKQEVRDKYKLVSKHDHAGRLIDTQEFRNLEFPLNRFTQELIDELMTEAAETVRIEEDKVIIDHVYIERRVRPLNLYINEVSQAEAEQAILDYGQTIKDLAITNIFPGDLLLKNFGLTRSKRVVFYDYDEVALVTQCKFRDIPDCHHDEEMMNPASWMYVDTHDIFPEEFIKFLSMNAQLRSLFLEVHGDLLSADYWRDIKNKHQNGEIEMIVPYQSPSFSNRQRIISRAV